MPRLSLSQYAASVDLLGRRGGSRRTRGRWRDAGKAGQRLEGGARARQSPISLSSRAARTVPEVTPASRPKDLRWQCLTAAEATATLTVMNGETPEDLRAAFRRVPEAETKWLALEDRERRRYVQ